MHKQARRAVVAGMAMVLAVAAMAHDGVQNPAVMARMDAMSEIGKATEILVKMAKGQRDFDAEGARQAAEDIAREAARTPALFAMPETDPKSEALPRIWEEPSDFSARATALEQVAAQASTQIMTQQDLGRAVAGIADTCKSCHRLYRE